MYIAVKIGIVSRAASCREWGQQSAYQYLAENRKK
jgi:hypothetical protein